MVRPGVGGLNLGLAGCQTSNALAETLQTFTYHYLTSNMAHLKRVSSQMMAI